MIFLAINLFASLEYVTNEFSALKDKKLYLVNQYIFLINITP